MLRQGVFSAALLLAAVMAAPAEGQQRPPAPDPQGQAAPVDQGRRPTSESAPAPTRSEFRYEFDGYFTEQDSKW